MKKLITAWRMMALLLRWNQLGGLVLRDGAGNGVSRVMAASVTGHPFGRKMRSRMIMTNIIATAPIMPIAAAKPCRQRPSLKAWSYMKIVQV